MLVDEKIVKEWYRKDSWMFRQFSFLFQNPLWTKKIPNGFSVCPYFWFSMAAFFLLRPFCWVMTHVGAPILKACGSRFQVADKYVITFWEWVLSYLAWIFQNEPVKKTFKENLSEQQAPPGAGLVVTVIIGAMGFLLGYLLLIGGTGLVLLWQTSMAGKIGVVAIITAIAILFGTNIYNERNKYNSARCNVSVWWLVWVIGIVLATMILLPSAYVAAGKGVWHGLSVAFSAVVYAVGVALKYIAIWLWIAVVFLAKCIWAIVSYCPGSIPIPWWAYPAAFVYFGGKLLASWSLHHPHIETNQPFVPPPPSPEEVRERNRNDWYHILIATLEGGTNWRHWYKVAEHPKYYVHATGRRAFIHEMNSKVSHRVDIGDVDHTDDALPGKTRFNIAWYQKMLPKLLDDVYESLLTPIVKSLEDYPCPFSYNVFGRFKVEGNAIYKRVATLKEMMEAANVPTDALVEAKLEFATFDRVSQQLVTTSSYRTYWSQSLKYADEIIKWEEDVEKRRIERLEIRKQSPLYLFINRAADKADVWCHNFTSFVSHYSGKGWNLCVAACKNLKIFFTWAWVFMKAKKQGACPYLKFEDAPPETNK